MEWGGFKYLQSPLTITILLAEEKKEMIGKLKSVIGKKIGKISDEMFLFAKLYTCENFRMFSILFLLMCC